MSDNEERTSADIINQSIVRLDGAYWDIQLLQNNARNVEGNEGREARDELRIAKNAVHQALSKVKELRNKPIHFNQEQL